MAEADEFIAGLDPKAAKKVLYTIDLTEQTNDPKLFKKLQRDIWEFRTLYGGKKNQITCILEQNRANGNLGFCYSRVYKKGRQSAGKRN